MTNRTRHAASIAGVALLAVSLVGCAHVKRDELQTELSSLRTELRSEYRSADDRLDQRITGVDGRVSDMAGDLADLDARTLQLATDLQSLAVEFGATVERLENAISFSAPVHFDYDSAVVRAQDEPVLRRFAGVVQSYYPGSLLTIEGFTDPAGSEAYNLALGRRRAEAVREFLAGQRIDPRRLRVVSYGEAEARQVAPGAQGPGPAGESNRRVALVIETVGENWDVAATALEEGQS